jgi:plastocyanin
VRRLLFAVVAVAALGACGGGDGDAASTPAAVTVRTFAFGPDPLTVPAGTTIVFTNGDKIDHTVTAGTREAPTPDVFDGRLPSQGSTFERTLEEPGTYDYFCGVHTGPGMTATIVVTA